MVRKKQFINKKTAQHFHVVHRSQRDPKASDPEASKYVLLSSSQPTELRSDSESDYSDDDELPELLVSPRAAAPAAPKRAATSARRRVTFGGVEAEDAVDADGLPRDGYDYGQHLKEMGHGRFYSSAGRFDAGGALARRVALPADALPSGEEQARLLDAITLSTDAMDADLREALENDAAFEALEDDFLAQADAEDAAGADDGFDYDAHIAKLMAAASGVPKVRGDLTDDEDEEDEEDVTDADLTDGEPDEETRAEEQRALDALFDKTLAEEYGDEQLGELEDDDPETRGALALDAALLEELAADLAVAQQELLDREGRLGNPRAPAGNRLRQIREQCAREMEAEAADADAGAQADGGAKTGGVEQQRQQQEEEGGAEEELADVAQLERMMARSAYLAPRAAERWDCETIVSTYSTLDNHPTVLREPPSARQQQRRAAAAAAAARAVAEPASRLGRVELSRKTGMPLGVFGSRRADAEGGDAAADASPEEREDRGRPRAKDESAEQKRARKAAARLLKTQRRADKKETKRAFRDEQQRQQAQTAPGRAAIFRY